MGGGSGGLKLQVSKGTWAAKMMHIETFWGAILPGLSR